MSLSFLREITFCYQIKRFLNPIYCAASVHNLLDIYDATEEIEKFSNLVNNLPSGLDAVYALSGLGLLRNFCLGVLRYEFLDIYPLTHFLRISCSRTT